MECGCVDCETMRRGTCCHEKIVRDLGISKLIPQQTFEFVVRIQDEQNVPIISGPQSWYLRGNLEERANGLA